MSGRAVSGVDVRRWARRRQWRHLLVASIMSITNQAGEALVPIVVGLVIDRAVLTGDFADLVWWLGILAAVFVTLSLSYRFGQRRTHFGAVLVEQELRLQVARRIIDPRGGAERNSLAGALTNVAVADVWRVAFVNYLVPIAAAALAGMVIGGLALLMFSVSLGLLVILGTPPLLYLVHLLGKPLEKRSETEQARAADASGVAVDLVRGIRVLKGLGGEPQARIRYRMVSGRSLAATLRVSRANAVYQGAVVVLNGLFLVLVALVAGQQAARGEITVGQLVSAVGLAQFLMAPMSMFALFSSSAAAGRASARRIADVLSTPPAISAGTTGLPDSLGGGVRFHEVAAGSLRDVSFDVHPGETVGVVAHDPADALAVVRCLSREIDPDGGRLELDGVAFANLDPDDLRSVVLATTHDVALFQDTVRATLESLGAGPDALQRATVAACVGDVVDTLPEGYESVISERGRSLSGGQRQRVALARSLAAEPTVLVLHEPTTAIDSVTERQIAVGIASVRSDRTTVLVTSSPTLLGITDRVVVLDGGVVSSVGAHTDLLRHDKAYRQMVLS